ncbi:Gfo/Idh/MocA family oxidoreductase [Candidatus Kaiserbacteria bacterium]|nr:Gfo/Idh/MocA family oxidoreductase [Candidatus Kaiserbacteria bacterium]
MTKRMALQVKIIGAGSIGNHLAQASRRMGWDVTVVDADPKALERMKNDIYPTRYGAWDPEIRQFVAGEEPKGGYDIIMIGTPPHVRMPLALRALKEKPRVLFLEKPLTFPFDPNLSKFVNALRKQKKTLALIGYDHAVAASTNRVAELLKQKTIGESLTLDVEFREHWQGIFKAHPWLSGPEDSYLGYWKKGGGASGEHSHALHLWQRLARAAGLGDWKKVGSLLKIEKTGKAEYDSIAAFLIETTAGKVGRVVQDVVTLPTRKWARVQGTDGFIEWLCNGHPTGDIVRFAGKDGEVHEEIFAKKRPDDFYAEMAHIDDILNKKVKLADSPLAFASGVAVMRVLETAWKKKNASLQTLRK